MVVGVCALWLGACGGGSSSRGTETGTGGDETGGTVGSGGSGATAPTGGSGGTTGAGSGAATGTGGSASGTGGTSVGATGGQAGASTGSGGAAAATGTNLSVFDNFVYTNGQTSIQLTLKADGTYQLIVLVSTSTVTADEEVEEGTFVLSGAMISFTPTERSCATALTPSTDDYLVNSAGFALISSSGTITFVRSPPLATTGLTLVVGCGSPFMPVTTTGAAPVPASPGQSPSLYGNWLYTNSNGVEAELTLNDDMTYEVEILISTSTVTANEYIENGVFAYKGPTLTLTPMQTSCPVAAPPKPYGFAFDEAGLILTDLSGNSTTYGSTTMSDPAANLTTVVGCSINNGPWMPEPIAPVTN